MKFTGLLVLLLASMIINAKEYNIVEASPYNPYEDRYETCEKEAVSHVENSAMKKYYGCTPKEVDNIDFEILSYSNREITPDSCRITVKVNVTSSTLESNPYLIENNLIACAGFDMALVDKQTSWKGGEVGAFIGLSSTQDALELSSGKRRIYYDYAQVPLIGLLASYAYEVYSHHQIGVKAILSKSFESYESTSYSSKKSRNDGDPDILHLETGIYYGYRYHIKNEFSVGTNVYLDQVERHYSNGDYEGSVLSGNIELGYGYYVNPQFKIWTKITQDFSGNIGMSWVY